METRLLTDSFDVFCQRIQDSAKRFDSTGHEEVARETLRSSLQVFKSKSISHLYMSMYT